VAQVTGVNAIIANGYIIIGKRLGKGVEELWSYPDTVSVIDVSHAQYPGLQPGCRYVGTATSPAIAWHAHTSNCIYSSVYFIISHYDPKNQVPVSYPPYSSRLHQTVREAWVTSEWRAKMLSFGQKLAVYRIRAGLSQEELAKLLRLDQGAIRDIEKTWLMTMLDLEETMRAIEILHLSLEEAFGMITHAYAYKVTEDIRQYIKETYHASPGSDKSQELLPRLRKQVCYVAEKELSRVLVEAATHVKKE
jgi:DNA-binding XRE family transcriptional regulator